MEGQALLDYDKEGASCRGKLWSPGRDATKEETFVPRVLAIPLVLFDKIRGGGRPLMPHEVLGLVILHLESMTNEEITKAWPLIAKWCLMAVQQNSLGNSWVAFAVKTITEGEDDYLNHWCWNNT
jgi:hypothetical protein